MSRPEHFAPPEIFYNDLEAQKYNKNTRMIQIQTRLSRRAIELLALPAGGSKMILDIGCGSGLSGTVLDDDGHFWVGCDISRSMLNVAEDRDVGGDLLQNDIGEGLPFRPSSFDGAIRAVLQFYPETPSQMEFLTTAATRAGFSGGLLVDYPNSTRQKKYYLVLFSGTPVGAFQHQMPRALDGEVPDELQEEIAFQAKRERFNERHAKKSPAEQRREWIVRKKAKQRAQGKAVPKDTKYTARRRPGRGF
ncbi:putative williams-beuren syndrome critical region protein [Paratrimastix pyriformis]|uniref:Williams-beuren syndrome critical region protein n=1 Tax=Paratrimastix pyriformis TaxID=342808 RepID=A0ABQ8UDF0_9EUKA|nr:putative williams-beuren syndrome critical region protein [Paratrimastix pyriformis]